MKKLTFLLILLIFTLTVNAQVQNYSLNDVVDDFTVTDIHGNTHNLYTYTAQGKYVYLDFFFDTCGPCQGMAPTWNEFYDKYGCNSGDVICISINNGTDNDAEVLAFENTYGGSFNHSPAVSNQGGATAVKNNFNPSAYPTVCLINPSNQIIQRDIWPIANVAALEATFPTGFSPQPSACTADVEDVNSHLVFNIIPNPTNGQHFNITLDDTFTSVHVEIIDILGKTVFTKETSKTDIKINSQLSNGTYFVKVTSTNSSAIKKMIVR